ncbi:uncharacterized protein LOC144733842 [Lampetra planeri]
MASVETSDAGSYKCDVLLLPMYDEGQSSLQLWVSNRPEGTAALPTATSSNTALSSWTEPPPTSVNNILVIVAVSVILVVVVIVVALVTVRLRYRCKKQTQQSNDHEMESWATHRRKSTFKSQRSHLWFLVVTSQVSSLPEMAEAATLAPEE